MFILHLLHLFMFTIILCLAQDDFGTGDYTETGDYPDTDQDVTTTTTTTTTRRPVVRPTTSTRRPTTSTRRFTTTTTTTQRPTTTVTVTRRQSTPSARPQVTTAPQDYDYDGPGFATDPPDVETTTTTTRQTPRRRTTTRRPAISPGNNIPSPTTTTTRRPIGATRRPYPPDTREWEEDSAWTRLANFIRQIYNDTNNVNANSNGVDYFLDRLGDFINIFRYQGYDHHHHFHHCTQLVGGCKFPIWSSSTTTTTRSPPGGGGDEDYEDYDEDAINTNTESVRARRVTSKQLIGPGGARKSSSSSSRSTRIIVSRTF